MSSAILGGFWWARETDRRLGKVEGQLNAIDGRIDRERESMNGVWQTLTEATKRLGEIEQRLANIEGRLGAKP